MLSKEFIVENKATLDIQGVTEGEKINLQDLEFRIRHKNDIIEIYAELDGVMVGYAKFNERADKTLVAGKVTVDPDYRRQGIATAIYNYAEQQGYTVIPSETQTELGREFWKDRKNKQGVAEGSFDETTEQFYNLIEWKKAARKLKMHIRVGYMAGTKGVKIYDAETEDQSSGGRFFAGPGWNYGHITVTKQGVAEGKNLPEPQPLEQKTFNELQAALGKTATNSLVKHPWYAEYGMYEKAYKHGVDGSNFHEVMVYPYMPDIHTTAEGKIRPTIMLQFSFSHRGKVIQVHKFIRDKEPSKEELRHPGSGWRLAKSWKNQEDVL